MRIEYAHFIKDRSVEKTEAELMLGDAINNYKTVQSFGYEEAIVDIYKGLLAPGEEAGHANNLCNSLIYGASFFILTAQGSLLNVYLVELLQRKIISDPARSFIIVNIVTSLTQEVAGKLGSIVEIAKGLAASELMFKLLD